MSSCGVRRRVFLNPQVPSCGTILHPTLGPHFTPEGQRLTNGPARPGKGWGSSRAQVGGLDAPLAHDWAPYGSCALCSALLWRGLMASGQRRVCTCTSLGRKPPEATKHYQNHHGSNSGKLKSLPVRGQGLGLCSWAADTRVTLSILTCCGRDTLVRQKTLRYNALPAHDCLCLGHSGARVTGPQTPSLRTQMRLHEQ